jgi:hypothetical protein
VSFVTDYEQVAQGKVQDRIRNRYKSDIDTLKRVGFEELCFCSEVTRSLGCILFFPLLLLMLIKGEVVKVKRAWVLALQYPLLVSREHATFAIVYGWGIKFYTNFTDGTALISANSKLASSVTADEEKYYKYKCPRDTETAWNFHRDKVNRFRSAGRQTRDTLCFEDYVEISMREEELLSLEVKTSEPQAVQCKLGKSDKVFLIGGFVQLALLCLILLMAFVRGVRLAAVGLVALVPVLINMVLIVRLKEGFFDLFDIPQDARLAERIDWFLLGVFVITNFLVLFRVLPFSYFLAAGAVWLLYKNCVAAFYRFQRLRASRKNGERT